MSTLPHRKEKVTPVTTRLERERIHFNNVAAKKTDSDLVMATSNIRRYDNPPADTAFPLEYAFHLLGDLRGKTVVDLGCGEGLNTVILASLGAKVISVDISDKSLELTGKRVKANGVAENVTLVHSDAATIPVQDASADRVLCAAILHHVDCVATARQIRRILRPGGVASFLEPVTGPAWLWKFKNLLPKSAHVTDDEQPLTEDQVDSVSRAVGCGGRRREFMLTTRVLERFGVRSFHAIKKSHQLDAWIMRHAAFTRALASPLVWEARKEP